MDELIPAISPATQALLDILKGKLPQGESFDTTVHRLRRQVGSGKTKRSSVEYYAQKGTKYQKKVASKVLEEI